MGGCLAPKRLLQKAAPTPAGRQREPCTSPVGCASHCNAGPCGLRAGCPTAGQEWPAHVGHTGSTAFRNAFFAGTPALLDCRADGPSLLALGLPARRPGQHLESAGLARPLPTIAHSQPPLAICSSTDLVPRRMYG